MAVLSTGQSFASGDQVTAQKLNDIIGQATFTSAASTTDNSTLTLGSSKLKVKDAGITSTQLATDSVITAKIQDGAVTANKVATDAIITAKIATSAVTTDRIADDAVTADKLAHTAVTPGSYTNTNLTVDQQGRITSAASGSLGVQAKCFFDGTASSPSASGATNIASVTKNQTGDYTVSFTSPISNPVASVSVVNASTSNPVDVSIHTITANNVRVITGTNSSGRFDCVGVHILIF